MHQAGGAQQPARIHAAHLHLLGAGEHGEHQLDLLPPGVVQAGYADIEPAGLLPRRGRAAGQLLQRAHPVAHELGRLLVPHGEPPLRQNRHPLLQIGARLPQHPCEHQHLHGAGVVLQHDISHQRVAAGGLGPGGGDHPG